jgi:regulator of protease activity HflC (stomatin/prohibitin superfamily)
MSNSIEITRSKERPAATMGGGMAFLLGLGALAFAVWLLIGATNFEALAILIIVFSVFALTGLYQLQPNEGAAITLFGSYQGTDRKTGLRWIWPWFGKKKVSLRVRNVTSEQLKVNDKRGNPIEIAANVVWRISDTAQALFDVDDYASFVNIEIDTGLRDIAGHYAYDHAEDEEPTLRADAQTVADKLRTELQARLLLAGIEVDEARISHLAYAPEIAGAMLRRQQAEAILSARAKIVTGAVTMVESALNQLSERKIVVLDDERKAAMVSNLLVVLCADREAQPVLNTGTLHS